MIRRYDEKYIREIFTHYLPCSSLENSFDIKNKVQLLDITEDLFDRISRYTTRVIQTRNLEEFIESIEFNLVFVNSLKHHLISGDLITRSLEYRKELSEVITKFDELLFPSTPITNNELNEIFTNQNFNYQEKKYLDKFFKNRLFQFKTLNNKNMIIIGENENQEFEKEFENYLYRRFTPKYDYYNFVNNIEIHYSNEIKTILDFDFIPFFQENHYNSNKEKIYFIHNLRKIHFFMNNGFALKEKSLVSQRRLINSLNFYLGEVYGPKNTEISRYKNDCYNSQKEPRSSLRKYAMCILKSYHDELLENPITLE